MCTNKMKLQFIYVIITIIRSDALQNYCHFNNFCFESQNDQSIDISPTNCQVVKSLEIENE